MKANNFIKNIYSYLVLALIASKRMCVNLGLTAVMFGITLCLATPTLAQNMPDSLLQVAKEHPAQLNLIQNVWNRYGPIADHYGERLSLAAIEALDEDVLSAVYSMEVFPGYFKQLAKKLGGKEAARFLVATMENREFLAALSNDLPKYANKPKLLGVVVRSHADANKHILFELEKDNPSLALRLVEEFTQASSAVRKAIIKKPQFAFFLLETKEDGVAAMEAYGDKVAEVGCYYKPGTRKEVIHELKTGGALLLAAYTESNILGWQTAVRSKDLYRSLAQTIGVTDAIGFLQANGNYIYSHYEDPVNPEWVSKVTFQVEALSREGLLPYTQIDPYSFAISMEVDGGKQLIREMGTFIPANLIYEYYPRHKVFLTRFLNRYGAAPLSVLYQYARQGEDRAKLEKIIDKFTSKGLLLVTYAYNRDEAIDLLLEQGFNRGENYLKNFSFDEYGIPSRADGGKDLVPELIKVTTNYFWYGTKPTWVELGISLLEVVEIVEQVVSMGASPVASAGSEILAGEITQELLVELAEQEASNLISDKIKTVAKQIVWSTVKKVTRDELEYQRFAQLETPNPVGFVKRIGKNSMSSVLHQAEKIALTEFLRWSQEKLLGIK